MTKHEKDQIKELERKIDELLALLKPLPVQNPYGYTYPTYQNPYEYTYPTYHYPYQCVYTYHDPLS